MKTKVTIFEDNSSRGNSLCLLINQQPGMECAGVFEDCSDVVNNIVSTKPDVVLMDINMPGISGIEAAQILRRQFPGLFIIMQTVFEDDDKIVNAIVAGANGYILKKSHPNKIIEGIHDVLDGGAPMTASVAKRVMELFQKILAKKIDNNYNLTEKEIEVLSSLVKGFSYKMIAASLHVSVFTINSHVRNVYKKLQVHSVAEAVSKAIQQDIV